LRPEGDAFGQAIWNHFHGWTTPPVLERDDGMVEADVYGTSLYFAPYRKWPAIEKQALRYVRGRVLDIGCGAGRHSLYLQEKGHGVTAIDASPLAVKLTRERGVRDARVLAAAQVDKLPAQYDTAIMFGHNLGLLGSFEGGRRFLKKMLRVSSRIVGTNVDPYITSDPMHLAYHRRNRRRGRMSGQIRIRVRYATLVTPWFDWLFLSRPELEELIDGTGWTLARWIQPEGAPIYAAVLATQDAARRSSSGNRPF
jgi:SAM-dependent methyltransferase